MDAIINEAAEYAAQVNSQKYKQLQRKQSVIEVTRICTDDIISGALYFADVPKQIKDEVKEALIRRNREDLIVE